MGVTLDSVITELTGVHSNETMLHRFLPLQLSQTGSQGMGRTCLKDLKVGFEDDLYSYWRYGDIDHLEVQAQVCEETCPRRVSANRIPS